MVNISYKNLIQIHNKAMVDCSNKYKFDQCLNAILTKFYSNLGVYNTLYWQLNHYNEARIIARSALESILLFSYLATHTDKIQEYYDESMLLEFRNSFIEIKELKTELSKMLFDNSILRERETNYIKRNLELFKLLAITRQKDILNALFTQSMKRETYEKQAGICPICKQHFKIEQMEADHITPWCEGGKTSAENCQMLCKECNRRKSNK